MSWDVDPVAEGKHADSPLSRFRCKCPEGWSEGHAELSGCAACSQVRPGMHLRWRRSGRVQSDSACRGGIPVRDGAASSVQSQWLLQAECMRQAEHLSLRVSVERAGWRPLYMSARPVLKPDQAGSHLRTKLLLMQHGQAGPVSFVQEGQWLASNMRIHDEMLCRVVSSLQMLACHVMHICALACFVNL